MKLYKISVFPEDHSDSKDFHFPKFTVHLLIFLFAGFCTFTAFMTWGFLHYRQSSKQSRSVSTQLEALQLAQLQSKISGLEETLQRAQQQTNKLESMIGVDSSKLKMGVGPFSNEDDFGKYLEKISRLKKNGAPQFFSDSPKDKTSGGVYSKLGERVDELSDYALALESKVNEVYEIGQDKLTFWSSTPSLWPVKGWLTSDFGMRLSPFTGFPKFHEGLDIAAPYGSPIYAPADGIVSFSGYKGGYGETLILDHGYGVDTLYGHTSGLLVKEGEKVKRGQLIATVGSSGASTGPHLHYEVRVDGVPTDPMKFVVK